MGSLLSCLGPEYEVQGETWQAQSKWHQQPGVIELNAVGAASTEGNGQASPLQPSPNLQMLQIPPSPQHGSKQKARISPKEDAQACREEDDTFPEGDNANLPQAPVNWTRGELIGAGAFGRVYLGLNNENGELLAIKQVTVSKDSAIAGKVALHVRELEREVSVLKQLNHCNIVRYLGTEMSKDCLSIFLEYVSGGSIASLLSKFGSFKEKVIKIYTRQILQGLQYLHDHKIMHRDIKGANILVDKAGFVKLADFGASKIIEDLVTIDTGVKSIKGTSYWMAPEVIKQTGHGRMADIWSVGCTIIEMATGKPPWSQFSSQVSAMFHIASSKGPPPIPEHLSPEAKDFLLLCFIRVPADRPNAARLLRHPFLADVIRSTPSGPLPDVNAMRSPYKIPSPMPDASEVPLNPKGKVSSPKIAQPVVGSQEFLRMYSPMANRLAAAVVEQEKWPQAGAQQYGAVDRSKDQNANADNALRESHLRQSVASKASTRYDGVDDAEGGSVPSLGSQKSYSDYNPVEEPSWMQQDSLRASAFHYDAENSPPNSPLHAGHLKLVNNGFGASKPTKQRNSSEGSLEDIMTFVKEKATRDVAQLSVAFQPEQLRKYTENTNGRTADRHASKQQQWEAEIWKELEEQRNSARRG